MDWKKRLTNLPVIMPGYVPRDGQCWEGDVDGMHFIATKTFLLGTGTVFMLSFSGNERAIATAIRELTSELGALPIEVNMESYVGYFAWRTNTQELPNPITYRVLGRKRVLDILKEFSVSDLEALVKETLIAYEFLPGENRISYAATVAARMKRSRVEAFSWAIMEICKQFVYTNNAVAMNAQRQKN